MNPPSHRAEQRRVGPITLISWSVHDTVRALFVEVRHLREVRGFRQRRASAKGVIESLLSCTCRSFRVPGGPEGRIFVETTTQW